MRPRARIIFDTLMMTHVDGAFMQMPLTGPTAFQFPHLNELGF